MRLDSPKIRELVAMVAPSDSYPLFFHFSMATREEVVCQRNIDFAHLPKLGLHRLSENYNVIYSNTHICTF